MRHSNEHQEEHKPMTKRRKLLITALSFLSAGLVLAAPFAMAQEITLDMGGDDGTLSGRVIQLLAMLTVLSLAPSILIMMTSFTRIIVVLSFLRTALGVQQTPPNTVIMSLALFLTFFVMGPTLQQAYDTGVKPLMAQEIDEKTAFDRTTMPFKEFMLRHTRETDLELFFDLSRTQEPKTAMETPLQVVIPAFMISELRRAFEIGFMLFLPFLIIDMVTASILMSMGMMMLPPIMISLPFKIIFFVLVDGWHLVAGSLVKSFDVTQGNVPGVTG